MPKDKKLTVFFLCETFTGYQDFLNRKVRSPQGLPPVYHTWNGYVRRGHRVHIFTQDVHYPDYSDWECNGWILHNVPAPFKYLRKHRFTKLGKFLFRISRLVGLYRVWKRALAIGREKKPDVVYSFSPWSSLPAASIAKKYGAVHIMRRFGTTLYNVIAGKESLWQNDGLLIEAFSYRLPYDLVIMGNDGTFGDKVSKHYGCPDLKLEFWTNGIDKTMYEPGFDRVKFRKDHGLPEACPIILAVSRLVEWKRIDRVIDVMARVKKARPDSRLIIVGSGYAEQQLWKRAKDRNVDDVTLFTGSVEHDKIKDYFNASDVYVQLFDLTNRCNPLFEAMCCALPIVTIEGPGTADLISHGETALCVKSNGILREEPICCIEPEELAKAARYILQLLDDEQLRDRLGQNARERVMNTLQTWDERIDMEMDVVTNLLNAEGKGRTKSL